MKKNKKNKKVDLDNVAGSSDSIRTEFVKKVLAPNTIQKNLDEFSKHCQSINYESHECS